MRAHFHMNLILILFAATAGISAAAHANTPGTEKEPLKNMNIILQNDYLKYAISPDATDMHFIDKRNGRDYVDAHSGCRFARVKVNGKPIVATAASISGDLLTIDFGDSGARAVIRMRSEKRYLTFEVVSVDGAGVEELTFANVGLTVKGEPDEEFAACALALNLKTNVPELPQSNTRLHAFCCSKIGFAGAKVAIIGCPKEKLRSVMQEVVSASADLPHSPIGGPWALDGKNNRGSYLFNFGSLSETKVDDWIRLAKGLGINQIDFHGGSSFRFGDCRPNPETYPNGRASLKAVIDKLHAAGLQAGLHTYAFFIAKNCPWVTPVPDPRLAKGATFTLAQDITAESDVLPTVESTEKMSTVTGFAIRNGVTLCVDNELITYTGISKTPPYSFTGCKRGAYGTKPAAHSKGAAVGHLKECFGLFVPDPNTTLFEEVAAKTAETFNECGFDMMYLDALDGEDILGGAEYGWHYGSKFVFEIWKRLKRPALMEMSTFHHHLWYVRSRMGAWDHPVRSHKRFIDIHCKSNESNLRMFLPGHLGWWAFKTQAGPDVEPTYSDDIEYLCAKCVGTDCGLSIMGVDPDNIKTNPTLTRLGAIVKEWEELRRSDHLPESVRRKLKEPGKEFTLSRSANGKPELRPVDYSKHKIEGCDERTTSWRVTNTFADQPVQLRIEALFSAAPYDSENAVTLADFADTKAFTERSSSDGVTADLQSSKEQAKVGDSSGCYAASCPALLSGSEETPQDRFSPTDHGLRHPAARPAGWSRIGMVYSPVRDLGDRKAIGVWVYGDGQGETLNFQVRSPLNVSPGIADHYIPVDFSGWRYFELIEPEGERSENYNWPYGQSVYAMYRELVNYNQIETFDIWYGGLPNGESVKCYLSAVKALPIVKNKLRNPKVTIGGKTIEFPVQMESGSYIEFKSKDDCKLYGSNGEFLSEVRPTGDVPVIKNGENNASFSCEGAPGVNARARVTLISSGGLINS